MRVQGGMSVCIGIQLWKPRENGLQSPHFGEIILTETADHSSHRSRWCHSGKADNRERAEKGEEEDLEERQHLKDWKRKGVFQKDWKEGKDAGGKQEPRENRTLRRRKCVVSGEITMMLFCTPHGTEIWLLFSFWALSLFTPVCVQPVRMQWFSTSGKFSRILFPPAPLRLPGHVAKPAFTLSQFQLSHLERNRARLSTYVACTAKVSRLFSCSLPAPPP